MAQKRGSSTGNTAVSGASKKTGRRVEKSELTRHRLFQAAIRMVGDIGYSGATIRKITSNARIAHGTFYNYFTSQQDIFDQILPFLGERLLEHLDERFSQDASFIERQDILLVAFDDFVRETPAFYRIMAEAEVFAPKAYRVYIANMVDWFIRHFSAEATSRDASRLEEQQLEVVALMVFGANHYVSMRYGDWMGDVTRLPSWTVETFQTFVREGMRSLIASPEKQRALKSSKDSKRDTPNNRLPPDSAASTYVKFTRHGGGPDNGSALYSAGSNQLDVRSTFSEPGRITMELDIDRRILNSRGAVSGGTMSSLVEVSAGTVLGFDPAEQISGETVGLNLTLIRAATEGTLFAEARMENAGRNIRFITVRIALDGLNGPTVAMGNVTMRVIE